MNKSLLFPIIVVAVSGISPTLALALALAKSDVAGGYDTGFARGAEEARAAINEFDMGSPKSQLLFTKFTIKLHVTLIHP